MPTHIVAVAGVVMNENGEILLVKHTKDGTWGCPGGQVENGENLIEALVREVKEESGIDIKVGELFWVGSNTATHEGYNGVKIVPTKVLFNFTCTAVGGELQSSDETSEACWVKREEVHDMLANPIMQDRFNAYLEYDGSIRYEAYTSRPYELHYRRHI